MQLEVDPAPDAGECGRPKKAVQPLTSGINDALTCPLTHYISKLDSYEVHSSISWYQGCSLIDGSGRFTYRKVAMLKVKHVSPDDAGSYTCTLTFDLAGVTGSVSETINAEVEGEYVLLPEIRAPAFEVIKAEIVNGNFIDEVSSDRVYTEAQLSQRVEGPHPGNWEERFLRFREVREEDLHANYTCHAYSAHANHLVPIAVSLIGGAVLFVATAVFYFLFKMDVVLWFRRAFPVFYRNTALVDSVEENMRASEADGVVLVEEPEEEQGGGVEEVQGERCRGGGEGGGGERFWKQMRYHMPVRGKRTSYPEKMSLLNL
ncbi:hypothetical protein CRUP_000328 [Coryphaenoides rupestris]|nr:hypothetical protein CRUP_000328 [Coryphaenoides rupestris]